MQCGNKCGQKSGGFEDQQEIVCCGNNCSGYSQEKCFKCNLVFPKLSRLKKGQQVKGFLSQGRKKGTEGKVFEAEAIG